ncbi:polyadenylate-specific 3'-exoribonuclease AS [Corynebacterium epidermidicanis]|uniref:3'-5' exoribonuclease n=1 Tax=Corynebacterium epidermidicanis TaxID=1050174 RepID=A0A0G3GQR0_9CORY|nr:polyadenylate-specific 3'-exoribonuclease AS [Corynebacterium epidermidicanis]AKK03541.1 hypothetical protein CEPID_08455 [Corynebacterium epidermidicanis]
MRYFYDTEFIEDGATIELVSIGIVSEDGREYYAVSSEFDGSKASPWVSRNVLALLPNPSSPEWKSLARIRADLVEFFAAGGSSPELWAWVGCYDHVVFAQLWGDMTGLPKNFPRFTRELKQYWEFAGKPPLPSSPPGSHDALVDARHNVQKFRACMAALPLHSDNSVV